MRCVICQGELDPALTPASTHPNCGMNFAEPSGEDGFTVLLRSKLTDIILAYEKKNPRGHQVKLGPSEIGELCDRRIAYRLAAVPECNEVDPWPAIMGTAVHTWLQDAVSSWMSDTGDLGSWHIEKTLHIDQFIEGHSDLYSVDLHAVIDWKSMGPNVLKKTRTEGPAPGYIIQAHVYGYGYEQAGYPVNKVALACLSRAGWLKDMYLWTADYNRSLAEAALARVYGLARQVLSLNLLKESHTSQWDLVSATPSNSCGFCPYYDPGRAHDRGADGTGCPGR